MPAGAMRTLNDPRINWLFKTEPDPSSAGRSYVWPRGKVLGGSSSINGMLYVRGQPADYDGWRQIGCANWSWEEVLPYFVRAQHQESGDGPLFGRIRDERPTFRTRAGNVKTVPILSVSGA
jgi:choline dehydrogenase